MRTASLLIGAISALMISTAAAKDCPPTPQRTLKNMTAILNASPFTLKITGAHLDQADQILRARIVGLGGKIKQDILADGALTLKGLIDGGQAMADALLAEGRLAMRPVNEAALKQLTAGLQPPAGVTVEIGYGDLVALHGADASALSAYVKTLKIPADHGWAVGPHTNRRGQQIHQALLLGPAAVTQAHLQPCEITLTEGYTGEPVIMLTLDEAGAKAFAAMTERQIRSRIAIVLDDKIQSAPVVQEPITGGKMQISLGASEGREAQLRAARALVEVLRVGPLKR